MAKILRYVEQRFHNARRATSCIQPIIAVESHSDVRRLAGAFHPFSCAFLTFSFQLHQEFIKMEVVTPKSGRQFYYVMTTDVSLWKDMMLRWMIIIKFLLATITTPSSNADSFAIFDTTLHYIYGILCWEYKMLLVSHGLRHFHAMPAASEIKHTDADARRVLLLPLHEQRHTQIDILYIVSRITAFQQN